MEASGNAAAMREVLEKVNEIYDILCRPCIIVEEARQVCRALRSMLVPALAAPPRNCDVGAPEEQRERFKNDVPFFEPYHLQTLDHVLKWAQMPYIPATTKEET